MLAVVVAGPYSGAHINPAVSIGLAIAGKFPWELVPILYFSPNDRCHVGRLRSFGSFIKIILMLPKMQDSKKAVFCTAPAIRNTFSQFI